MTYRVAAPLLLLLAVLPFLFALSMVGCDKATPVAPDGSILVMTANPTKISLNGTSTITVVGRKPDGQPLNPGTEIRLSATNGSIPSIVTADSSGTATAIFQSNGTPGNATITAATGTGGSGSTPMTSGGGTGSTSGTLTASITIQVGVSAKTITVQPTPTSIPATSNSQVALLALVRDANGQPQPNQAVNFTTDLGTLDSRGAIVTTDAGGVARDTLRVKVTDLSNNATAIHVTAQTAGSDGGLVSGSATITVQSAKPIAKFKFQKGSTDLEVVFTDQSTGPGALSWTWDFGDGSSATTQNPRHTYTASGTYTVQLTVTDPNTGQSSVAIARITVPVTTPGTSG